MSTLRHLPVKQWKDKFNLISFVETGTFEGDGIRAALNFGFKRCFSCDLKMDFAIRAAQEFSDVSRVSIVHSDSLNFLVALPFGIGPVFYWLDAHQPGFYGCEETYKNKFPVVEEIEVIKHRPGFERDVIVVDDLIVIKGSPRFHENEINDYFHIDGVWDRLYHSLDMTHDVEISLQMEGYLVFTPKISLNPERIDS
jgi:hypothetical protein